MTNLEFIKTLKTGVELNNFLHHVHYGCTQYGSKANEVYKSRCLSDEYRGENGCRKCQEEFWEKEFEG